MFDRFHQRVLATNAGWAPLVVRIPVGIIFIAHGAQKLFGRFGGYGLEATGQAFESMGLNPGLMMALLAGTAEFFGGILLGAGFLVRPAAAVLAFTMVIAIFAAHFHGVLFLTNGGYEYALALLAVSASLLVSGAGRASVDDWLAKRQTAIGRATPVAAEGVV